jgi:hypothetical protein
MGWIKNLFHLQPKNYGEYYVYALIDPRFQRPFYIGKGSKDRGFQHERDMRRLMRKGTPGAMMALSCKHKRILEILDSGVIDSSCTENCIPVEILFRTDEEGEAYRVERHYIAEAGIERLTNETYGLSDKAIDRLINRRLGGR